MGDQAGILGFRKAWPRPVVDALMRAVMPKSMHGLDLATCKAQLEPGKWAQKELVKRKRLQASAIEEAELEDFSKTDLAEILNETGGVVRKNDTWNDLAVKVRNPNPAPIQEHHRPKKSARVAEDADEPLPLVQREKSSSGRSLRPPSWRRDLGAEK